MTPVEKLAVSVVGRAFLDCKGLSLAQQNRGKIHTELCNPEAGDACKQCIVKAAQEWLTLPEHAEDRAYWRDRLPARSRLIEMLDGFQLPAAA